MPSASNEPTAITQPARPRRQLPVELLLLSGLALLGIGMFVGGALWWEHTKKQPLLPRITASPPLAQAPIVPPQTSPIPTSRPPTFTPPVVNAPAVVPRVERPTAAPPIAPKTNAHSQPPMVREPSQSRLQLDGSSAVPTAIQNQIRPLYEQWKREHAQPASSVDRMIALYAPDAAIYTAIDGRVSVSRLRQLAVETREAGYFTGVTDVQPPHWAGNSAPPTRVELLAQHRYTHRAGGTSRGQRRLIWEKKKGTWKIVRDDFPPFFVVEVP